MGVIHISGALLSLCRQEVSRTFPLESGGVLMGRRAGESEWFVDHMVGPGPEARHARYRFSPDHEYQRQLIAARFLDTRGESTYLGDWHSHPKASHGRLSLLDRHALGKIMDTPEAQCPEPLMMILWGEPDTWSSTIWHTHRHSRGLLSRLPKVSQCRCVTDAFA